MRNKEKDMACSNKRYVEAKLAYAALMLFYPFNLENLEGEFWDWISGYEGLYQISTFGRIKSFIRNKVKICKPMINKNGYLRISLRKNNIPKIFSVHRLVAQTFIPNPKNLKEVNHKFGNKFDNYFKNLEWCTDSENKKHAFKNGLMKVGVEHHGSKLTTEQVCYIRENYKPYNNEFGASALARKYNVHLSTILDIIHRISYKDIK